MAAVGRGRRRRRRVRGRRGRRIGRFLLLGALVLALAPALPVGCLRAVDPPTSAVILRHRLRAEREGTGTVSHQPVPLSAISPHLAMAVLAAEDQRFFDHWGLDGRAIRSAVEERMREGRVRGASTITQQVAKNLFLWKERSWLRKGLEAWLALWIDALWPKRRILEVYLNLAQMGPRCYGAEAASRRHFGHSARALSPREAALLAAVLPNPRRLRLDPPSDYVRGRAAEIRERARALGGPSWPRRHLGQ